MFRSRKLKTTTILTALAVLTACGDDATGPDQGADASVQGRVEETTPPASSSAASAPPQSASGTSAEAVTVVQIHADGSFTELATAGVGAGGSFMVEGVPSGRSDLAVVAYLDGQAVGSVLIHEESRAGVTIVAAPIDAETTLEARTYTRVRAGSSGEAAASELSLLVQARGATAAAAASSETELTATAEAYVTASSAMTATYQLRGQMVDASARADIFAQAAVAFASNRSSGMSATTANRVFAEAAFDALVDTGADLEATVMATAGAASTFDARLEGSSSVRGDLMVQPIRLNLLARERLAADFASSAESSVALAIQDVLVDARASLSLGLGLLDLRALIDGALTAVVDAGADACVTLLAAGASSSVQAEVRTRAETALEAARLDLRLESATTAEAVVSAMAGYRTEVKAAVEAMIAVDGSASADAEVLTSLFIAAGAGAHIR